MDRSVDLSSPNSLRTDDAQRADHVEGPHVIFWRTLVPRVRGSLPFFRQTKIGQGRNECRDKWIKWRNGEIENNAGW